MASLLRALSAGEEIRRSRVPQTLTLTYLEQSSVQTLLHSVSVLDKWLKENEGHIEDEVRLRRVKHWRKEALEQLRLEFNLSKR